MLFKKKSHIEIIISHISHINRAHNSHYKENTQTLDASFSGVDDDVQFTYVCLLHTQAVFRSTSSQIKLHEMQSPN